MAHQITTLYHLVRQEEAAKLMQCSHAIKTNKQKREKIKDKKKRSISKNKRMKQAKRTACSLHNE